MASPRIYKVDAIILRRNNVGETDRILTILTKQYGKMRVIAKGIRSVHSRRGPHLEVFNYVALIIHHGKTLDLISEAGIIENFPWVSKKLDGMSVAYYFSELVDSLLPEKQEHGDIFVLLLDALRELNNQNVTSFYSISQEFSLKLLKTLGYLNQEKMLSVAQSQQYIESILEKHLRTPKILRQLV